MNRNTLEKQKAKQKPVQKILTQNTHRKEREREFARSQALKKERIFIWSSKFEADSSAFLIVLN